MNEEPQEPAKQSSRHRSPTFSKEEIKELVHLVYKFKHIIMDKSITSPVCHAKDEAWEKIGQLFNSGGFEYPRSVKTLRVKWDSLKKEARKVSSNIIDATSKDFNEIHAQVLTIICETENSSAIDQPPDLDDELETNENGEQRDLRNNSAGIFWEDDEKQAEDISMSHDDENERSTRKNRKQSDDENERRSRRNRSLSFSPNECKLLLQCVRKEKQYIFCKDVTTQAIRLKNSAWSRITDSYNQLSPRKRSTKVLRTKFSNMKRLARQVGFKDYVKRLRNKHKRLDEDDHSSKPISSHCWAKASSISCVMLSIFSVAQYNTIGQLRHVRAACLDLRQTEARKSDFALYKVKKEPEAEYQVDGESDWNDNHEEDDSENPKTDDNNFHFVPDPLSSVLNGDSGIGSSHTGSLNHSEPQDVVKLRMELLNYQIETAKLERKRIEDALQEEATARESRAIETALRLRAARLEATAAEMKFPPSHPALHYTQQETRAQQYLTQYQT